jgi:hypothetical protein
MSALPPIALDEEGVRHLLSTCDFTVHQIDYRQVESGARFEYKMVVQTVESFEYAPASREAQGHARHPRVPSLTNWRLSSNRADVDSSEAGHGWSPNVRLWH